MKDLKGDKAKQFFMTYGVFLLNGMLALSIGSLLPFIRDSKALEYAFCGFLVSLHSVGNLISSFFAGAFANLFAGKSSLGVGKKRSILLFNACFALSYLIILLSGNTFLLAAAFLMTGLARGATSNFCNTAINSLAPGKAWTINGLHAMFSVGAFTFPILLMLMTANGDSNWIYACVFMLVMGVLSWLIYFLMPVGDDKKEEKEDKGKSGNQWGFFREPLFYLVILTLFFYLCAEQGVIGWLITYLKDTGLLAPSVSQLMASVQWIMMLVGRLGTAWMSTKVDKEKFLPFMGVGLVLFYIILIRSTSTGWIVFGIMGFGLSMAGIYPTTVSFAGNLIQKYPLAWSFILTIASIGSIVMPSIIGAIAESAGILYGMTSVAVVVVVDLVCIVTLVSYMGKVRKKNSI